MGRALPQKSFDGLEYACSPWRLSATGSAVGLAQTPSVFAIGNGFIGVRGPGEPIDAPRVYLNGVFERVPITYHEAAFGYARESDTRVAVADATRPAIAINGRSDGLTIAVDLDYRSGICTETLQFGDIRVEVERFASMTRPGLVLVRVVVPSGVEPLIKPRISPPPVASAATPDTVYDPRVAPKHDDFPWQTVSIDELEHGSARVDRLNRSGTHVSVCTIEIGRHNKADGQIFELVASYSAGETCDGQARGAAEAARRDGFEALFREQREWFASHWDAAQLAFSADQAAEGAVRHALLQLVQNVARDGSGSIPAKGQTGEGYEGHVFWDADLYVLPVFAWTRPDIARAMLIWRIGRLEAARANAREMGHRHGALYPWRTIGGRECSSFFPAGSAQYHINADIAFALRTYVEATGDRSILDEGGAEMLAETARVWLQIGFHDPDRGGAFVINRVTGPDEYSAIVDNNLYTNLLAAAHLGFAASDGAVDATEAAAMRRAAEAMLLPFDESRDVFAQDDAFFGKQPWPFEDTPPDRYPLLLYHHPLAIYRHQVAKQADAVLAVAILPGQFAPDMRARMLDIYERVTVHDSTLSASAFATAAAHCRDASKAYSYWRAAALTDLADLFGNSGHGLHMAALAGSWTTLALGFAGLAAASDAIRFDPIAVPALGPYSFTVRFHRTAIRVAVGPGEVRYDRLSGPPVTLIHGDERITLDDRPIQRPLSA